MALEVIGRVDTLATAVKALAPGMPAAASPELWVCTAFLGFSLICYALLGGADYGAGLVEITLRGDKHKEARRILEKALGPVWEANHIWLILAVVILFMGFPPVYARMSVSLHLPLTAALLGLVARGTSFTFRHYDAVRDGSRFWYNWIFRVSSVWTPFWLGMTLAGMSAGRVTPHPDSFAAGYIRTWFHPYGIYLGAFTVALFAFLASAYLVGESQEVAVRTAFARRARTFLFLALPLGALVFLAAQIEGRPLFWHFLHNPPALTLVGLSALSLPVLEKLLRQAALPETLPRRRLMWALRVLAGLQGMAIITAWFAVQYPVLFAIRASAGASLTLFNSAAPTAVLWQLDAALLIGSVAILPALFWLFKIFLGPKAMPPRR